MPELPYPFNRMLSNFKLARARVPDYHKSVHWNCFPEDYERTIEAVEAWPFFLRNAISVGFNDTLMTPGAGFQRKDSHWDARKNADFTPLLPEFENDPTRGQAVAKAFNSILAILGSGFVSEHLADGTGSPCVANIQYDHNDESRVVRANSHDLGLVYYAWQIIRIAKPLLPEVPTIVEIGGGHGETITKIKTSFPKAKCILFDLPETNAVSSWFLSQRFPEAKILFYEDVLEQGSDIFASDFDFCILPGWAMESVPAESVDLVVNARSMMEMTKAAIAFYFEQIHRISRNDGLFYCANRYEKKPGPEAIRIKEYPYDSRWRILLSQSSIWQSHIHELMVERTEHSQSFTVMEAMRSLQPF